MNKLEILFLKIIDTIINIFLICFEDTPLDYILGDLLEVEDPTLTLGEIRDPSKFRKFTDIFK